MNIFNDNNDKISMGRVLSFIASIVGLLIFTAVCILSVMKGQDIGANIMQGCVFLVSAGILGKGIQKFAEIKK